MSDIYELHDNTFSQVSAYVVLQDGERVATVAFKHPPRGHGERRLWCYVHILGTPMVRGYAAGFGYDKHSAAFASACEKLKLRDHDEALNHSERARELEAHIAAFQATAQRGGEHWDRALDKAGYTVLQAV